MVIIGSDCLLKNTDLAAKIRQLLPIINLEVGAKNGKPTFRQVRLALIDQTGVDIDLDTFADMYKSEIPQDLRFTSDEEIDDILNVKTKAAFEKLTNGSVDRVEGIGETSTDRAAVNKVAGILSSIEGRDKSNKTKTLTRTVKDAVLSAIQKLANSNENYKEMRKKNPKETFEQTLERVFEINSLQTEQMEADKLNTIQDVMEQARENVIKSFKNFRDDNGEEILSDEALAFMDQYKNAVFGVMMSTGDANTLIRGALLEVKDENGKPKFAKGPEGKQTVDWKGLAGSINSPAVLRENVIDALKEGKGLTEETATSIADALATDFKDLVQGEKAMKVKYALAEAEATNILDKLGWKPTEALNTIISDKLKEAIDQSVEESDELNITEVVHNVLQDEEIGVTEKQIANLPNRGIILKPHTANKIAKLIKDDGELDADALAELYKTLGKAVDDETINELRRLSKLKEDIENLELTTDTGGEFSKITATKQGIEKAKAIKTISDNMARVVAKSIDYSGKNGFQRFLIKALNVGSKYVSTNAALVLLNPFNLTQNILSGAFTGTHAKVGGRLADTFGSTQTPLIYKTPDGKKINLSELLNDVGRLDTWWNTLSGAEGRDIPDLFTGDASKDVKTFQTAETKGEKVEAAITAIPRAALTATDAMLKEPYFRKELIRGVLYHLQKAGGKTKQEAQDLVYEALTKNSPENLMKQAKELAEMVGKGNDKYYIKQVAEDIQLASMVMIDDDGRSVLSEQNLQSIIDAAKQTSAEVFGHRIQKKAVGLPWIYDLFSGARAKAIESVNKDFGEKMAEYYKRGEYDKAAWLHFSHTLKTAMGFLFQRGIYNWAILMAQKNPLSILTGFKQLSKQAAFNTPESTQESVENYLRSRAKIGRGVMGTATAMVMVPLVMAAIKGNCGDDKDCIKKRVAALRKDPVWGRIFNNFVSPVAQATIDGMLSDNIAEGTGTVFRDMLIKPVVSAGSKYYSVDNMAMEAISQLEKGKVPKAGALVGGVLGGFLPGKGFLSTNKAAVERAFGKDSPGMIDENFQIVLDSRKMPKPDDFWDAFWYSSVFKNYKKK